LQSALARSTSVSIISDIGRSILILEILVELAFFAFFLSSVSVDDLAVSLMRSSSPISLCQKHHVIWIFAGLFLSLSLSLSVSLSLSFSLSISFSLSLSFSLSASLSFSVSCFTQTVRVRHTRFYHPPRKSVPFLFFPPFVLLLFCYTSP
jgi:hypothetical protein